MTALGWICLTVLAGLALLGIAALRWVEHLAEAAAPAARYIGRAPLPPTRTRAEIIADLEAAWQLPDYVRPPSATADSYLDPEDLA